MLFCLNTVSCNFLLKLSSWKCALCLILLLLGVTYSLKILEGGYDLRPTSACDGEDNGTPLQYSCLKIPRMEESGRLQSMGSLRVGHDWATSLSLFTFMHWRREMAAHSSLLAWRIPGTGEPSGLLSMGSHRVGHDWSDLAAAVAAAAASLLNFAYLFFLPLNIFVSFIFIALFPNCHLALVLFCSLCFS